MSPATPKKVIVIPGYFGSINVPELASCDLSFHSSSWTGWSESDPYYQPLIQSLTNAHFTVLPFYYDWRRTATENSNTLDAFVKKNIPDTNEKFDIVAHSFGGLVARAYLELTNSHNRVDRILTAGTPHRGSALAYPAWSAGEIWYKDSEIKDPLQLFMKWCTLTHHKNDRDIVQSTIPSTRDLLPIDDYLFTPDHIAIPVSSMHAKNSWLLSASFPNNSERIVGTLSGTDKKTLASLTVTSDIPKRYPSGDWQDGYPKNNGDDSTVGDDTVLNTSSVLPQASINITIPNDHATLLSSQKGQKAVLNFLGANTANVVPSSTTEITSALGILTDPGQFWVVDPDGHIVKDTDHFYFATNPKKGTYRFLFLPSSTNAHVLIGKFLPNGKTVWKTYIHPSVLPKLDTIEIDENE